MKKPTNCKNLDLLLECLKKADDNIDEMKNAKDLVDALSDDEIEYMYESRLVECYYRQMRKYEKVKE